MSIEFTVTMVRALKGAPLSCLMILALARQPLSAQYLERTSGYSDKTVNSALLLLEDYGLVSRNGRYFWQIVDGVQQLPLMGTEIEDSSNKEIPVDKIMDGSSNLGNPVDKISDVNPDNSDNFRGTRRNSDSEKFRLPSSSRSLTTRDIKDPLPLIRDAESEKFRVAENLAECEKQGICEPKRSVVSKLEHVNPRLIKYHCQTAGNLGQAIYRIEKNWRIKTGWIDPGENENTCVNAYGESVADRENRRRKYLIPEIDETVPA